MGNIIIPKWHKADYEKPKLPTGGRSEIGDGTPRSAVKYEDVKHIKATFSNEGMSVMTKNGTKILNDVLRECGFNVGEPVERVENHPDKGRVTFFQCQEWEDDD